jgi:hypothetical protein
MNSFINDNNIQNINLNDNNIHNINLNDNNINLNDNDINLNDNDNDNDNSNNSDNSDNDDNIYDLDETSLNLIYKSSQKEFTEAEINILKKKTLQEEIDDNKNKIIIKTKKRKVKNIIDISFNNKNINNRQFNPRLPPYNLRKK